MTIVDCSFMVSTCSLNESSLLYLPFISVPFSCSSTKLFPVVASLLSGVMETDPDVSSEKVCHHVHISAR